MVDEPTALIRQLLRCPSLELTTLNHVIRINFSGNITDNKLQNHL